MGRELVVTVVQNLASNLGGHLKFAVIVAFCLYLLEPFLDSVQGCHWY